MLTFIPETALDEGVIDKVQRWLEVYLRYTKDIADVDGQAIVDSLVANRGFWLVFLDFFMAISARR